jgi:hypothetical protein
MESFNSTADLFRNVVSGVKEATQMFVRLLFQVK